MEWVEYAIRRDCIYVGEVVKAKNLYRDEGKDSFFRIKPEQLHTASYDSYRTMLFTIENHLAKDLLYKSPNYPILNITDDAKCLTRKEGIVIKDACNLELLLEYFGYKQFLLLEDIIKIRKRFFNGQFAMKNCRVFGWNESNLKDYIYYDEFGKITDPEKRKKRIKEEKRKQSFSTRTFTGIFASVLPPRILGCIK